MPPGGPPPSRFGATTCAHAGRVSIWDAAAPPESQAFLLVGALVLVPLILGYTAWSYWVFRGKVDEEGYH